MDVPTFGRLETKASTIEGAADATEITLENTFTSSIAYDQELFSYSVDLWSPPTLPP
jgi:hypothetical protein